MELLHTTSEYESAVPQLNTCMVRMERQSVNFPAKRAQTALPQLDLILDAHA